MPSFVERTTFFSANAEYAPVGIDYARPPVMRVMASSTVVICSLLHIGQVAFLLEPFLTIG